MINGLNRGEMQKNTVHTMFYSTLLFTKGTLCKLPNLNILFRLFSFPFHYALISSFLPYVLSFFVCSFLLFLLPYFLPSFLSYFHPFFLLYSFPIFFRPYVFPYRSFLIFLSPFFSPFSFKVLHMQL